MTLIINCIIIFVGNEAGRNLGTARAKVLIRRGTSPVPHGFTGSSCGTAAALHSEVSRWAAGGLLEERCRTTAASPCYWQDARPGMACFPRSGHSIAGIDHRTVARCRDLRFGDLGRTAQQRPGACTGKRNNPPTTTLARGEGFSASAPSSSDGLRTYNCELVAQGFGVRLLFCAKFSGASCVRLGIALS